MFIFINMPYFSEEINGKMKTVCKFQYTLTLLTQEVKKKRKTLAFLLLLVRITQPWRQ